MGTDRAATRRCIAVMLDFERESEMGKSGHGLRRGRHFAWVRYCVLTAAVLCIIPTAVRADTAETETVADAQCMIVGAQLSASKDPQQRVPGQMILMYYLGRIDGRSPKADLRTLIKTQTQKMTESDFKDAAGRCGKEFSARGDAVVEIGKSLGKPAK